MYKSEQTPANYQHRFHAGNVGDVWKHIVLLACLKSLPQEPRILVETHAGEGMYNLATTGEWQEGVGALLRAWQASSKTPASFSALTHAFPALSLYAQQASIDLANRRYRGSPLWMMEYLQEADALYAFDTSEEAIQSLRRHTQKHAKASCVQIEQKDGFSSAIALLQKIRAEKQDARVLVHVDPPYTEKEDWRRLPAIIDEMNRSHPQAVLALWYPIKSYTRVTAMIKELQRLNTAGLVLDLITTPLELQRNRLNGSGMLLVNAPATAIAEINAAASFLGPACATQIKWRLNCDVWGTYATPTV